MLTVRETKTFAKIQMHPSVELSFSHFKLSHFNA